MAKLKMDYDTILKNSGVDVETINFAINSIKGQIMDAESLASSDPEARKSLVSLYNQLNMALQRKEANFRWMDTAHKFHNLQTGDSN